MSDRFDAMGFPDDDVPWCQECGGSHYPSYCHECGNIKCNCFCEAPDDDEDDATQCE